MDMWRRLGAEFFGTFWLTFAGCGSAVLAADFPSLGIGFLGVGLAFGLTVLTMAYAVGHVSGRHFNCAVTIGLWAGGRFKAADVLLTKKAIFTFRTPYSWGSSRAAVS
jgi:aquaporin Z